MEDGFALGCSVADASVGTGAVAVLYHDDHIGPVHHEVVPLSHFPAGVPALADDGDFVRLGQPIFPAQFTVALEPLCCIPPL